MSPGRFSACQARFYRLEYFIPMKRTILPILVLIVLLLAACNTPPISATPTETPTPAVSPTPAPSDTPTPPPGRAILLSAGSANADVLTQAEALLGEQAAQAGLSSETRESLQPADLQPEVKLVVALAPPANLSELIAAAPQTQFIVISAAPLDAGDNLTVIRLQAEQQAFVAGLVTTLISDDWRAAGMIPADAPALQNAFVNGGAYFCGTCSPGWPLGVTFPLVNGAAAPGDGAAWAASAVDFFDNGKVESFYLSAAATRPEVISYLAGRSQFETAVKIVGELPPPDELRGQWAATVDLNPLEALAQALPTALQGKGSGSLLVPVSLSHVNPDILSPGRLDLVSTILDELAKGIISPMTVPPE